MLRSKLKIRDLKTHQEYLLLITKMNLKGVLVESSHTLAKGSQLRLSLQLDDGKPALNLKGIVHKVAQRPDGSRAMIISFVDPDIESQKRIRQALGSSETSEEGGEEEGILSRERTMMVDEDTLSNLSKKATEIPKEDSMAELMPNTMDEESVQAANPGLAGSTRIISSNLKQSRPKKKSKRSFMKVFIWLSLLGVGVLAFLIFSEPLLLWLQDKPNLKNTASNTVTDKTIEDARPKNVTPIPTPNPIVDTVPPEKTPTPNPVVEATPKPTPKPKPKPKKAPRRISSAVNSIKVDNQSAFVKITLEGQGSFEKFETSKVMSPKRLVLDLPGFTSLKAAGTTAVAKNPVLRVRSAKTENGVRVTVDLYPVTFPRFNVKTYSKSLELFIFR